MRLIDLSQPIYHASPNCPSHPSVSSEVHTDHATDGWRTEILTLVNHTGSHIDAALHKIVGGRSIDEFPLESFAGPAYVADLRDSEPAREIVPEILRARLPETVTGAVVLLATGWGAKRAKTDEWHYHSPRLTPDGAKWLIEQGIRGVGIDHYSIGGSTEPLNSDTHAALLAANVWILEDIIVPDEVFALPQPCTLWCLPIHLKGHSGSFCRPVIAVDVAAV